MNLKGIKICITGASRGLGKATALTLAQKGAELILLARDNNSLRKVSDEIAQITGKTPLALQCDITQETEVQDIYKQISARHQSLDVLINNAGIATYDTIENISGTEMRRHFEVNVFGTYYCIKALLPLLKKADSPYVLNIGSLLSLISFGTTSVYASTKFACAGLTEGLNNDLKKYNIKTGILMPGPMKTSLHENQAIESMKPPEFMYLNLKKVTAAIAKMIEKRKKQTVLTYWRLCLFKLKRFKESRETPKSKSEVSYESTYADI